MSNNPRTPMEHFEMGIDTTSMGEAANADQSLLEATLREAAADTAIEKALADKNLTEDESDRLRLLAEIEKASANNTMTRAMGASSRFDWEISQLPGQAE